MYIYNPSQEPFLGHNARISTNFFGKTLILYFLSQNVITVYGIHLPCGRIPKKML
jgi:hypothetical protein